MNRLAKQAASPHRECVRDARRVIIKVGSAVIAGNGRLRPQAIADLAYDVTVLMHRGHEVVLVVSGAVAAGFGALGLDAPPKSVVERQAAACVGQYKLMTTFASAFGKHRVPVAQLLMMEDDINNRRRFLSARHSLQMLINKGIVPIINENDPLADDENKIGDNDHLAALVTNVVSAQLLIILSVVPGVYRGADSKELIDVVEVDSPIDEFVSASISESGVGGMKAKVSAARLAARWGVPAIIADGKTPGLLPRITQGESIGTIFQPRKSELTSRKRWIAIRTRSRGALVVDDSSKAGLLNGGAGLGPEGVIEVRGRFGMGSRVDILDASGAPFAVGLVSYPSNDIRRMRGKSPAEFRQVLGYEYVRHVVSREDLVVLDDGPPVAAPKEIAVCQV